MVVKTNLGRALEAAAVVREFRKDPTSFMFAISIGEEWWDEEQFETKSFKDNEITLDRLIQSPQNPQISIPIKITSSDGNSIYQIDVDYTVTPSTSTVTRKADGAIPEDVSVNIQYTAGVSPPLIDQTSLPRTIGYLPLIGMDYVTPLSEISDPAATTIRVDGELYVIVPGPTRLIFARAVLPEDEGVGPPIKGYGLQRGMKLKSDVEAGKRFFAATDFDELGALAYAAHRSGVPHDGTISFGLDTLMQH